jgi:hypothetical protein
MRNLIICPVGNPITFDARFDQENHWRYVHDDRKYETLVFQYSDYVPDHNTYDRLIEQKGFKWSLAKEWLPKIDYTQYDYIGFMDDDLITDRENVNRTLDIAYEKDLKIFQLSVTQDSDMFYSILKNKPGVKYTKTNFVEVMGPFIHSSLIPKCIELWNMYDIYTGWGFDKVLCQLTETDAAVIHASQMYHPKRSGNYDKSKAFAEMDKLLYEVFPRYMRSKGIEKWQYIESQIEKEIVMVV